VHMSHKLDERRLAFMRRIASVEPDTQTPVVCRTMVAWAQTVGVVQNDECATLVRYVQEEREERLHALCH
jgi:hypothetical protein